MTPKHYPAWVRRRRRGAADRITIETLAIALAGADADGIRSVLDRDVVLVIDGGGQVPAPTSAVAGADAAAVELMHLMTPETSVTMASINSVPGFVLVRDDLVVGALTADVRAGVLTGVWVVCNPDKLRHWNRGEA